MLPRRRLFRRRRSCAPWIIALGFALSFGVGLGGGYWGLLRGALPTNPLPTLFAPSATPSASPTPTLAPSRTPPPTATFTSTPIPLAHIAEAEAALNAGDWATAIHIYQTLLSQSAAADRRASAQFGLGRARWLSGDPEGAIADLARFTEDFSDSDQAAEAQFLLGEAYRETAQWDAALQAYAAYAQARPDTVDSYVYERIALVAQAQGEWPMAINALQEAINAPRDDGAFDLRERLASIYAANDQNDLALKEYETIATLTDQNWRKARMDVLAGQLLYRLGRADEAYAKFLDAVNHYPEAPITFEGLLILVNDGIPVSDLQRGLTNYYASNYEPAVAAFERGLALTGTAALAPVEAGTALYYRALSLTALGRDDEAIVVLQELVNAYPTDPLWAKAYWQIAFIQPYPEAVETLVAFAKAAPSAPAAPEALYRAARLRERNGALAEAAALWTQIAENYPKAEQAADAALQAGLVFYRAGDEGSALTRFQQALALAPDAAQQARAWLWIGKTRQKQGDRASAQSAYQTAAALDPYGYYSLRAAELLRQETPFTPPNDYAVIFDKAAERAEAEQWLREHFPLAQGIGDLGALPPSVWREPRFTRGAALWQLGLLPEAHAEFDSLRRDLAGDPLALWPLALYWSQIGAYDLTIRATRQVIDLAGIAGSLNVPRYFLRLRYPTPFSEAVIAASADYDLHPFLMYAKMRLESFFWKYSYSSAAARGLNQIIPSTADDIARRLQLTNFTYADLYRPSVSIPMGAFYLDFVGQTTGHAPAAMLAGYYAGPGNAQLWLGLANGDPDLFVEVIRLPDARGYVQTAYEYFAVYREVWGR